MARRQLDEIRLATLSVQEGLNVSDVARCAEFTDDLAQASRRTCARVSKLLKLLAQLSELRLGGTACGSKRDELWEKVAETP